MGLLTTLLGLLKHLSFKHVSIIAIITLSVYVFALEKRLDKKDIEINNHIAAADSLEFVFEDTLAVFERLTFQYEDIEEQKEQLENDFNILDKSKRDELNNLHKRLQDEINDKGQKIISLTNVVIELESIRSEGVARVDTIIIEGSFREQISFEDEEGAIGVKGYTLTNPPEYFIEKWLNPIGIQVYITDNGNNQFSSYLLFSDNNIQIPISNTYVVPNQLQWQNGSTLNQLFKGIHLAIGVEYKLNEFSDKIFYIRGVLPIWRFNQHIKVSENDLFFLTEYRLWGSKAGGS